MLTWGNYLAAQYDAAFGYTPDEVAPPTLLETSRAGWAKYGWQSTPLSLADRMDAIHTSGTAKSIVLAESATITHAGVDYIDDTMADGDPKEIVVAFPGHPGLPMLGSTYYDGVRVFYQLAEYTGDTKWNHYARQARYAYRDAYVLPANGGVPGYWNFSTGLYRDWQKTGDPASAAAVVALSQHASYAAGDAYEDAASTAHASLSRENAYGLMSHLDAEKVGESHRAKTDGMYDNCLDHIDQWFITQDYIQPNSDDPPEANGKYYIQPFMVAITCRAMIEYNELYGPDIRVVNLVRLCLDWLWENAWVPADGAFWYDNWKDSPEDAWPAKAGAPDLNLMILPLWGWLYTQLEGSTAESYRQKGHEIFNGGVAGAWLQGGKQFNQNYFWSWDYLKWCEEL